jgi:hypothetical protein
MRHALLILAACLCFPALAQQAEPAKSSPERDANGKSADKQAERPAAPQRVIEISRSSKTNCDVKPVMTDDEIARCKKAWSR